MMVAAAFLDSAGWSPIVLPILNLGVWLRVAATEVSYDAAAGFDALCTCKRAIEVHAYYPLSTSKPLDQDSGSFEIASVNVRQDGGLQPGQPLSLALTRAGR